MNNNDEEPKFSKFIFIIGGFSQGVTRLELIGTSIRKVCNNNHEEVMFTPTIGEWEKFSESLKNINFWNWREEYSDTLILDGTQWELTIQEGSMKKTCCGSNKFPPDFSDFVVLVNRLVKDDVISEVDM